MRFDDATAGLHAVALVIGLVLLLLIVKIFSGVSSGNQLQKGLARIQENGRIAMVLVNREVRKAGFRTKVWVDPLIGYHPITANSVNGGSVGNDTFSTMRTFAGSYPYNRLIG